MMTSPAEPLLDTATASTEDRARAQVYALLGALLAQPPQQALLKALRQIEVPASEIGSDMAAPWGLLRQAAERVEPATLEDEYQELFVGIGRGELVPYGSWYVTGFLMEKPLAELRVDLRRLGFECRDDVHEPEDHVAALCETMSLIASSPEIPLETQREFFEKHLGPWMGRFFGDLASARAASFYRAVGLLGEKFLEVERAYLAMTV
jgi:TorA maturation chaperone TorD